MSRPLIVVQEQIDLVVDIGQVVDQSRYDRLGPHKEDFIDQTDCGLTGAVADILQDMRRIKEKPCRFVVVVVKRKPGDRIPALLKSLCPSRRQASLAETSGRLDHGQPLDLDLIDEAEQTRSIDQPWRRSRRQYLRREDSRGGVGNHRGDRCWQRSSPQTSMLREERNRSPIKGIPSDAKNVYIIRQMPSPLR